MTRTTVKLFILSLLSSPVLLQTTEPGCNCVSCKTVSSGDYAGTYSLSEDTDQQDRCSGGCYYTNTESGEGLCMCDPGDVEYTLPDSCEVDDEYVTLAKALIDSGTCDSVASNGICGDSATSYYRVFEYNGARVVLSSGVPDHPAEYGQVKPNPNKRCEKWQFIQIPINPTKANNTTPTKMGSTGLASTGGHYYNHLSNPDGSLALPNEGESLDPCFGHSDADGTYHYHANINCTDAGAATGANNPDECVHIGYYNDGVPIYGFCKDSSGNMMTSCYKLVSGATTSSYTTAGGTYTLASSEDDYEYDSSITGCNLDEANGGVHPITGVYSYFATTGYPWLPIYYYGSQGVADSCSMDSVSA